MPTDKSLTSKGLSGGRDRDRTCDPYHVNLAPRCEPSGIVEKSLDASRPFGTDFPGSFTDSRFSEPERTNLHVRAGQARDRAAQLRRIFNRRATGWAPRDLEDVLAPIMEPLAGGRVACRSIHLSAEACGRAAAEPLTLHGNEGRDHAVLRRAAALWMCDGGATDAREEARCWVGRADAFSARAGWIVECGATPMAKLVACVMSPSARRFTLIPYQRLRWPDGSPRRLVALDFAWDLSIAAEAEASDRAAAWARMRARQAGGEPRQTRPWLALAMTPTFPALPLSREA